MKRRIDELKVGDVFRCSSGHVWIRRQQHGANRGAYYAERLDGASDLFARCALVEVVFGTLYESPPSTGEER